MISLRELHAEMFDIDKRYLKINGGIDWELREKELGL